MPIQPTLPRQTSVYSSPLGPILLAASSQGLAGLWFEGQKHGPRWDQWPTHDAHPLLKQAKAVLDDYFFKGKAQRFILPKDLALDLSAGTPFQQSVWQALLTIPAGQVTTYGALSAQLGAPKSVRAVGAAVGKNPISVLVPCHRVVGKDGSLVGYAGGLARKAHLLALEKGEIVE